MLRRPVRVVSKHEAAGTMKKIVLKATGDASRRRLQRLLSMRGAFIRLP
jgi:hypothetical protein